MPLSPKERRALIAQSHGTDARLAISANSITPQVIEHIRRALETNPLLKIRVQSDDRSACDRAAETIANGVPCEVVRRIGRVLILFRESAVDNAAEAG